MGRSDFVFLFVCLFCQRLSLHGHRLDWLLISGLSADTNQKHKKVKPSSPKIAEHQSDEDHRDKAEEAIHKAGSVVRRNVEDSISIDMS